MTLEHSIWGICSPPPARLRNDPMPPQGRRMGWGAGGGMSVDRPAPILGNGLPGPRDAAWWGIECRLSAAFVEKVGRRIDPAPLATSLRFAHPQCEAQVDALRAVYNGEVAEPEGGRLPRVWKWEHEDVTWWLVELPPELQWAWRNLTDANKKAHPCEVSR